MPKLKALVASLLISTVLTTNLLSVSVFAKETTNSYSITNVQGYTLKWESVQGGKVLGKVTVGNVDYTYTYNNNKNRITKTSKKNSTIYNYNSDSRLISEVRGTNKFTYQYDELNSLTGFNLNNTSYKFVKDSDLNVIAITDTNDIEVAKYNYDKNGILLSILGKDSSGNWIDKSNDDSFIGKLNLIRLHSYYFDAETGWYYNGYQYYDVANNQYVGGTDNLNSISTFEDYSKNTINAAVSADLVISITKWRDSLLSTSTFGKSIPYSSGWYNNLSDVELLSRLLYGENTVNSDDQNAVAWVLINRKINGSFGGSTFRGVAIYPGAFEPLTGGSAGTTNARVPDTSNPRWRGAVWTACSLLSTSSTTDYASLIAKPSGISNQLYFVGLNYFLLSTCSKNASPLGSGLMYSFNGGSSYVGIKDVCVVFSTYDTLTNPGSLSTITSNSRLNTYSLRSTHNIFFNTK